MLTAGTVLQARYVVDRPLGRGGMGAVYFAVDRRLGKPVAVKQALVAPDLRDSFEREARLLAGLRHAGLPGVTDYFVDAGDEFLVMDYVPGEDLSVILDRTRRPFEVATVVAWADELLDTLEYLHGQHPPVVHRDIKPSNIKLTDTGNVMLLDFGIAKGAIAGVTQGNRSLYGYSLAYAPFEQIQGSGTTERSDLYALGATLYHLLTGVAPVDAATRALARVEGKPDPLLPLVRLNAGVPAYVSAIVHRAMAISASERPATAAELRAAFREAASGEETIVESAFVHSPQDTVVESDATHPRTVKEPSNRPAAGETVTVPRESLSGAAAALVLVVVVAAVGLAVLHRIWMGSAKPEQPPASRPQVGTAPQAPAIEEARIRAGEFVMGSDTGDRFEQPRHRVRITRDFYLMKYEVTQRAWQMVMGSNPSATKGDDLPVENVSWDECQTFIRKLNELTGRRYRLPTEAEWEYACRAGTTGDHAGNPDAMAWHVDNSGRATHVVGRKLPNAWGLYDMNGNVAEWCQDWHGLYSNEDQVDPHGPSAGTSRIIRGGDRSSIAMTCTSATRSNRGPGARLDGTGFRLARTID